jgi:transposase
MGAGIAITRTDKSSKELREAAARTKNARAARRMLAIASVLEGADRTTAARTAGMDRQTLRDWVHRYNDRGVEGLVDRKAPGAEPKLSPEHKRQLCTLVEAGPDPQQDGVVRWRRIDLRKKIEELWGVRLHERSVGKILRSLGYRRLSTRPRHPRSDEAAQEAFKKTSPRPSPTASPRTPAASRSRSGSRTRLVSASRAR